MKERVAHCMLVAKVLVADGIMTDDEKEFLQRAMDRLGLSSDERDQIINLEGWDEAEPIAASMSAADKQEILDQLAEAALVDGRLSKHEQETVERISKALKLDE